MQARSDPRDVVLPPIPAKRYFTIGEVSELCAVKPHVLRYWEQEFTQLRPMKRRGNRRYYQHHEVLLVRRIRELLYEQGFTISGARNRLADSSHRARAAAAGSAAEGAALAGRAPASEPQAVPEAAAGSAGMAVGSAGMPAAPAQADSSAARTLSLPGADAHTVADVRADLLRALELLR